MVDRHPRDAELAPDLALIDRARAQDAAAFAELFRRHREAALRYARSLCDPVTAEDVVSEAFVRVFEAIDRGKGPRVAFRPYLLSAVRNTYVRHVRQDQRYVWTDDHAASGAEQVHDDETGTAQESRLLAQAFGSLPERWQAVIWHTTVEGDSHETVGRLLGIKANAVAALSFRAREGLRRAYLAAHLAAAKSEECEAARQQLPAYVRGRLGRRQRREVDAHLRTCQGCAAAILEANALNERLGALLAPALLGAAGAGYAGSGPWPSTNSRHGFRTRLAEGAKRPALSTLAAAVAVVLATAVAWSVVNRDDPEGSSHTDAQSSPSRPGAGQPTASVLPDRKPTSGPTASDGEVSGPPDTSAAPTRSPGTPSTPSTPKESLPARPGVSLAATPRESLAATPRESLAATPRESLAATPRESPAATPRESPAATPTTSPAATPTTSPAATPTTSPAATPREPEATTADLAVGAAAARNYGTHRHLEMTVTTALDGTTLSFDIPGLLIFSVHQDRDFAGTTCVRDTIGTPSLRCALAGGTGVFAIDVVVIGALCATARVDAPDNQDPDPTNNTVWFADDQSACVPSNPSS